MADQKLTLKPAHAGQRLDKVLAASFGLGRAAVRKLFDEGRVRIGRRVASKGDVLEVGSAVNVDLPEAGEAATPEPEPAMPLVVLFERTDLLVVEKPAGQPTAPLRAGETGTLANAVVARFPETASVGFHAREPGLVHRLDTGTSGVLVVARTSRCFDALVAGLKAGELDKHYIALCEDNDLPDAGVIEVPLAPHPKDSKRVLACLHPRDVERLSPRPARTEYSVERRSNGLALVRVHAARALRHQIRAHLAALGCPITGDALYGAAHHLDLGRHALHASTVAWGGTPAVAAFEVVSRLPPALAALLD